MLERLEADHPDLLDQVMRSRFRSAADHSLPSSLSHYFGFAHGTAVTGGQRHGYVDLAAPDAATVLALWTRRRDLACLCVNDSGRSDPAAAAAAAAALDLFFTSCYPLPSRWERTDAAAGQPSHPLGSRP